MPFDLLGYYNENKDYYGNTSLDDVAKDAYSRLSQKPASYDDWKKQSGVQNVIDDDNYNRALAKAKEPTGFFGEVGRAIGRGFTTTPMSMASRAAKWVGETTGSETLKNVGNTLGDVAEYERRQMPGLEPTSEYENAPWYSPSKLVGGVAEIAPTLIATGGAGGLAGRAVAPIAGRVGASLAEMAVTGAPFYASGAQETYEQAKQAGVDEDKAKLAGHVVGGIQGLMMPVLGMGPELVTSMLSKPAAEGVIKSLTSNLGAKEIAKNIGKSMATDAFTMSAMEGASTYARNKFGITDDSVLEAAAKGIPNGMVFGLVMGGGRLPGKISSENRYRTAIRDALVNPEMQDGVPSENTIGAINTVYNEARKINPEMAENFRRAAFDNVNNGRPAIVDDQLLTEYAQNNKSDVSTGQRQAPIRTSPEQIQPVAETQQPPSQPEQPSQPSGPISRAIGMLPDQTQKPAGFLEEPLTQVNRSLEQMSLGSDQYGERTPYTQPLEDIKNQVEQRKPELEKERARDIIEADKRMQYWNEESRKRVDENNADLERLNRMAELAESSDQAIPYLKRIFEIKKENQAIADAEDARMQKANLEDRGSRGLPEIQVPKEQAQGVEPAAEQPMAEANVPPESTGVEAGGENVQKVGEGEPKVETKQPWEMTRNSFSNPSLKVVKRNRNAFIKDYKDTGRGIHYDTKSNTVMGEESASKDTIDHEIAHSYTEQGVARQPVAWEGAVRMVDGSGDDLADFMKNEKGKLRGTIGMLPKGDRFDDNPSNPSNYNWQETSADLVSAYFNGELSDKLKKVVELIPDRNDRLKLAIDHRKSVEKALSEGKPVPEEVLADYPDLKAKYQEQSSSETTPNAPESTQAPSPIPTQAPTGENASGEGMGSRNSEQPKFSYQEGKPATYSGRKEITFSKTFENRQTGADKVDVNIKQHTKGSKEYYVETSYYDTPEGKDIPIKIKDKIATNLSLKDAKIAARKYLEGVDDVTDGGKPVFNEKPKAPEVTIPNVPSESIVYSDTPKDLFEKRGTIKPEAVTKEFQSIIDHAKKTGVDIRFVDNPNSIEHSGLKETVLGMDGKEGKDIKGLYHDSFKEIYIFTDRMKDMADVAKTVSHELIGHRGLYEFMGKDLVPFLDYLSQHPKYANDVKRIADKRGMAFKDTMDKRQAAKEYFADLVENNKVTPTLWSRLTVVVKNALRKLGFKNEWLTGFGDSDLAEIVRGSWNAVEKGSKVGKEQTGRMAFEMSPDYQIAYHGTPHVWQPEPGFPNGRPRLDKIGTGEGAQAYGFGWYSAENPFVATEYKNRLSSPSSDSDIAKAIYNAKDEQLEKLKTYLPENGKGINFEVKDSSKIIKEAIEMLRYTGTIEQRDSLYKWGVDENLIKKPTEGSTYKLDIPDSVIPKLLDWDKPMSEQSEYVKDIVNKIDEDPELYVNHELQNDRYDEDSFGEDYEDFKNTGKNFYESIVSVFGNQKLASEYLAEKGIPGNKYLDGMSRGKGEGSYNYVIWDQPTLDKVALLERNQEKLQQMQSPDYSIATPETKERQPPKNYDEAIYGVKKFARNAKENVSNVLGGIKEMLAIAMKSPEHFDIVTKVYRPRLGEIQRRESQAHAALKSHIDFFDKISVHSQDPNMDNLGLRFAAEMDKKNKADRSYEGIPKEHVDKFKAAEKVVDELVALRREKMKEAGMEVPESWEKEGYFGRVWKQESIRAFNKALNEYLDERFGAYENKDARSQMDEATKKAYKENQTKRENFTLDQLTDAEIQKIGERTRQLEKEGDGLDDNDKGLAFFAKTPLKGKEGFLKKRTINEYETAIKLGLAPLSNNPMDVLRLKLHEMDQSYFGRQFYNDLENPNKPGNAVKVYTGMTVPRGLVEAPGRNAVIFDHAPVYIRNAENVNKGKMFYDKQTRQMMVRFEKPIDGNKVLPFDPKTMEGGELIQAGKWYVTKEAADVINRHQERSLYQSKLIGQLFKNAMYTNNLYNRVQLGGSGFHAGETAFNSWFSGTDRAIQDFYDMLRGKKSFSDFIKSATEIPAAPYTDYKLGGKVIKAYNDNSITDREAAFGAKAMEIVAAKPTMDEIFNLDAKRSFLKAYYSKDYLKMAQHSVPALIEAMAAPIMEKMVPNIKAGVFTKQVMRLADAHGITSPEGLTKISKQLNYEWNHVDAILGEVQYKRLLMNNAAKNMSQLLLRSGGWTGGTLSTFGGAVKDAAHFFNEVRQGKMPDRIPTRVAHVVSLLGGLFIVNGFMTKILTGDDPKGADWWAFRTGDKDIYGREARMTLPTYGKDFQHYRNNFLDTLSAKTSPIVNITTEMLRNKDYYGTEIYNKDDKLGERLEDIVKYAAKQFTPFSVRGMQKLAEENKSPESYIAPFFGLMPAPKSMVATEAEQKMDEYGAASRTIGARTKEAAERSDLKRKITREFIAGNQQKGNEYLNQAIKDGKLSHRDITDITGHIGLPALNAQFRRLKVDQALKVWELATPEEKAKLSSELFRKYKSIKNEPAVDQQMLYQKFQKALSEVPKNP